MALIKQPAPPESLRNAVEIKEDGLLYWRDLPENKLALSKCRGKHIGAFTKPDGTNYARLRYQGKRYPVHRVVFWLMTNGEWPEVVDHIDRNKLNNRYENLRAATLAENRLNSTCIYSITSYTKKDGTTKFWPRMMLCGKSYPIGCYTDELTALFAAWKMRDLIFPGFAPIPDKLAGLDLL